ncbi:hypothetical protein SAMN05446935_6129 [Burkholderia sp. YR290]|nr:hypothetical protein SAMN05446935_6129 [Burkholderia sp. YR290]
MTEKLKTITVGELRNQLEKLLTYPDCTTVTFGIGNLSLSSIKPTGYTDRDRATPSNINFEFLQDYQLTFDPEA